MVLPDSDRVPRVPPYSGTAQIVQVFVYGAITLYGRTFQTDRLTIPTLVNRPTTPLGKPSGLGSSVFARRY